VFSPINPDLVIIANANWTLSLFGLSKLGKTPEIP